MEKKENKEDPLDEIFVEKHEEKPKEKFKISKLSWKIIVPLALLFGLICGAVVILVPRL